MVKHRAWRGLSGPAVKVWLELRARYNGGNNGRLTLSLREAAELLGMGKTTAQRAFAELQAAGFLSLEKEGCWYGRKAHEWRCTDIPMGRDSSTRDWQHRKASASSPEKKQNAVPRRDSREP